jgi:hypothetical protein
MPPRSSAESTMHHAREREEITMTVDYESLATLLPITFTALFTIAFATGLFQQWAASRKQVRVDARPETRRAQSNEAERDRQ